jgi:hypothetical protein
MLLLAVVMHYLLHTQPVPKPLHRSNAKAARLSGINVADGSAGSR